VIEHGQGMRWHTTVGNHRTKTMDFLVRRKNITIGFSDAGAHLRNMAFYNFPIRLLERVRDAEKSTRRPFLTLEKAVWKLTGELGEFYNLDAGRIEIGARADVAVIDPEGLHGTTDYHEAYMDEFGLSRMVNRNDAAVPATIIGGRLVSEYGQIAPGLGQTRGSGRFLPAHQQVTPRPFEDPVLATSVAASSAS